MPVSKSGRIIPILLIGCLSMLFAEVFAGASQIWILNFWSLLVTFPLYLTHLLLLLNLAMRTKRTSIPQLYLWGAIFALYEAWITKVLWTGYPGSGGPILGFILGIATVEFIVLVFFWHPIMAFILPILIFELLSISKTEPAGEDLELLPGHLSSLSKSSLMMRILMIMIFLGSAFLAVNTGFNVFVALIASASSVGLVFILYKITGEFSIHSLKLGNLGLGLISVFVIGLNVFWFFFLLPENIPTSFIPILMIVFFYLLFGLLIGISKPREIQKIDVKREPEIIKLKELIWLFIIFIILSGLYCLIPFLGILLFAVFTFGLLGMGPILFIYMSIKSIRGEK